MRSYQHGLSTFASLSVCLFLGSLRGNLLGIAPLLSSPLPGCCCCCLYFVTTVCTQPGAPSNATSLSPSLTHTHTHSTWQSECVFAANTHVHLMFVQGLSPLLCVCLSSVVNPWIHSMRDECLFYHFQRKPKEKKKVNFTDPVCCCDLDWPSGPVWRS